MTEDLPRLTPAQFEILDALWRIGPPGGTTAQVWRQITERRQVVRTTILKAIERLESYGWLTRKMVNGGVHFWPVAEREEVEHLLMRDVLHSFFDGSPGSLVKSLLGSGEVNSKEALELREIVEEATRKRRRRK
jgi:predicted transcriptional regulator